MDALHLTDSTFKADPQPRIPAPGEPAPFFTGATDANPRYSLDVVAGKWVVLMFFGTLGSQPSVDALALALQARERFDDRAAAFYGISLDPADRDRGVHDSLPGVRFFWDFDGQISRLYGLAHDDHMTPAIFLLDPMLRVVLAEPIEKTPVVMTRLHQALAASPAMSGDAPVLILPGLLEPELCQILIRYFEEGQPTASGFSQDVDGRTVLRLDPRLKRRHDVEITHPEMIEAVRSRLRERLFPLIRRFYNWQPMHIERDLICRYDADDAGFFVAHRDDVTLGTAHRKFAVSINLNTEDYEGGDLRFPEFGSRTYRPPSGGCAVFCCSMLHEATPVTRGKRYAVVPFLYDEEGARLRDANMRHVGV